MLRKTISAFVIFAFLTTAVPVPGRAGELVLPAAGVRLAVSPAFMPPMILGLTVDAADPMKFNFLIDQGDQKVPAQDQEKEFKQLIKYFLASLTIPEKDLWVNLSPYEGQRIIPQAFGQTEMGRDLLGQDYVLKQITASLIYPESELGKKFWADVYKKAHERFGTTNIPVNTFNKVWIVPDEAMVYEHDGSAFVVKSHLKVLLEADYLAMQKANASKSSPRPQAEGLPQNAAQQIGTDIVRQVVLPALEKEVNEGRNFALLRQINNALVLATWYKRALKESLLSKFYVDKAKIKGVDHADAQANEKIYQRYLQAFKKGVYNYIKEETDPYTHQTVPRKYFSGGFVGDYARVVRVTRDQSQVSDGFIHRIKEGMGGRIVDVAMRAEESRAVTDKAMIGPGIIQDPQLLQPLKDFASYLYRELAPRWSRIMELSHKEGLEAHLEEMIQLSWETIDLVSPEYISMNPFQEQGIEFEQIRDRLITNGYVHRRLFYDSQPRVDVNPEFPELEREVFPDFDDQHFKAIQYVLQQARERYHASQDPVVQALLNTLRKGGKYAAWDIVNMIADVIGKVNLFGYSLATKDEISQAIIAGDIRMQEDIRLLSNIMQRPAISLVEVNGDKVDKYFVIDPTQFSNAAMTAPSSETKPKYRILFVDDDPDIVWTSALLLKRYFPESEVVTAGNGQDALEKFMARQYSLLIIDGRMPRMYGAELIRRVREVEKANGTTSPVPFIIQSATADRDFSDDMRRQALAVFDKPYDVNKMIELLKLRQEDNTIRPVDAAMNAAATKTPGGIDLNPANLNLRIKRDGSTRLTTSGKGVPLPMGQQDMGQLNNIEGLMPVIIKIVPATHIPALSDVLATVN